MKLQESYGRTTVCKQKSSADLQGVEWGRRIPNYELAFTQAFSSSIDGSHKMTVSWPSARKAWTTSDKARRQAGEGATTPSGNSEDEIGKEEML